MQNLLNRLRALGQDRVLENEPMSRHTTFRVGGAAEAVFLPASSEEVLLAISAA